jgi:hypothetical protein
VEGHAAQRPRDQRRGGLLRGAQRQVVAVGREVDLAVLQVDVDQHFGKALAVVGQHAREARRGTPHRRAHLELAARRLALLADGGLGGIEQVERAPALLVPGGAGLGQAQVAARSVQEPRVQGFFELCHMLAGHRRRHRQALGCGHEAARFDDLAEHAQAGQAVHGWFPRKK